MSYLAFAVLECIAHTTQMYEIAFPRKKEKHYTQFHDASGREAIESTTEPSKKRLHAKSHYIRILCNTRFNYPFIKYLTQHD